MRITHLMLLLILFGAHITYAGKVRIEGTVKNFSGEALMCTVIDNGLSEKPVQVVIPMQGGNFGGDFEVASTVLFSISDGTNYFGGFVEAGDSIVIQYDYLDFERSIVFQGRGKEKFEIMHAIGRIKIFLRSQVAPARANAYPVDYLFGKIDSLKSTAMDNINRAAGKMNAESHYQVVGFLNASVLKAKINSLVAIFGDSYDAILKKHQEKLSLKSVSDMHKLLEFDDSFYRSKLYVSAVRDVMAIYLEENVQPQATDFSERKYYYLSDRLPPKLRTPVLFMMLDQDIRSGNETVSNSVILSASDLLSDSSLKQIVKDKIGGSALIGVGHKAPEFSLQNLAGEKVSLASFAGKTVYIDFWFAACGPCHSLFKAIEPVKKHFEADDRVVFLTVSIDDEKTWKKAITRFGVKGYHVFTENKFRDHPVIKSYQVGQYPTTYIINSKGEFHSVRPSGNPEILKQQIIESVKTNTK
jgi:peroxiredoxin